MPEVPHNHLPEGRRLHLAAQWPQYGQCSHTYLIVPCKQTIQDNLNITAATFRNRNSSRLWQLISTDSASSGAPELSADGPQECLHAVNRCCAELPGTEDSFPQLRRLPTAQRCTQEWYRFLVAGSVLPALRHACSCHMQLHVGLGGIKM
jgi:hypothetical protein